MKALVLSLLSLYTVSGASRATEPPAPEAHGVVVEEVAAGSALEKAGIRAGDVLLSWQRRPNPPRAPDGAQDRGAPDGARGRIASPFDWSWLEVEQAPRGAVLVEVDRGGDRSQLSVAPGWWQSRVRPRLPAAVSELYLRGRKVIAGGDFEAGLAAWTRAAEIAEEDGDWRSRCWLLLRGADERSRIGATEAALEAFDAALAAARDPLSRTVVLDRLGDNQIRRNDFDGAAASYRSALEIRLAVRPVSLSAAVSYRNLGVVAWSRDRLQEAEEYHRRSLEIRDRLAPGSLAVASSLTNLGIVAFRRGDLQTAVGFHRRALALRERLAPDSPEVAGSLVNLGNAVGRGGDLSTASTYFTRALGIYRRHPSGHFRALVSVLNSLGVMAQRRGELEQATDFYRRALDLQVQRAPGTYMHAGLLNNLGSVAHLLGESDLAADYQSQALEIQEKVAPGSLYVAESLTYLAMIAAERGDTVEAERRYSTALEIRRRLAPSSLAVAETLNHLALLASDRGDTEGAGRHLQAALEIQERLAPISVHIAATLDNLGRIAHQRGDPEGAAEQFSRALEIWQKLAPRSSFEAETLYALGKVYEDSGRPLAAADTFDRAIDALEAQIVKLGGSQGRRGSFRARHSDQYRDAVRLHIDLGRPEQAFHVMERSRGQSFLALMAERDLVFAADVPEDLEHARRQLAIEHDRIQNQLTTLDVATAPERFEALSARLRSLFERRDVLAEEIREASPRLGAIRYPRALDLPRARQALDRGTVMLAYSVGRERTELFVVTGERGLIGVESLEIGALELEQQVRRLRRLLAEAIPGSELGGGRLAQLEELARRLYRRLMRPAESAIEEGERILILPDGPLHLLPFSGLIRDPGTPEGGHRRQYVIEWRPLHFALSATVYAELVRNRRPAAEAPRVAAFGDPVYPAGLGPEIADEVADARLRSAVRRDLFDWGPLPHTRREILQIAALFENTDAYLGAAATEERAKSLAAGTRIVHFATHSHLDDRFPLNSALVLTLPEGFPRDRDNGLLQAWEIFERVRLDADLVVLSACQSALGEEQAGEGLLGLSRAFQYAGARTVAATLWSVADQTTPELMQRFYRHLESGKPTDEAMQAAQVELIHGPIEVVNRHGRRQEMDASAPFYWAAFQIFGDWR